MPQCTGIVESSQLDVVGRCTIRFFKKDNVAAYLQDNLRPAELFRVPRDKSQQLVLDGIFRAGYKVQFAITIKDWV